MTVDTDKTNVKLLAVSCKFQPVTCNHIDDDPAINLPTVK